MSARLHGRTALVTGSTDGIGEGIALALADEGAYVVVSGRNAAKGDQVVTGIPERGGWAAFVAVDLAAGGVAAGGWRSRPGRGGWPARHPGEQRGAVDRAGTTADVSEHLIDEALAVNIKAVFLLTGLLAPAMVERGRGAIVNVGSINGLIGMGGSALYSTTKAAIHSLTKSWAAEFGPSGVRVNTVAPGPTLTARNESIKEHLAPLLAGCRPGGPARWPRWRQPSSSSCPTRRPTFMVRRSRWTAASPPSNRLLAAALVSVVGRLSG